MDSNGEFLDIELDAVAIQTLFQEVGANQIGGGCDNDDCC